MRLTELLHDRETEPAAAGRQAAGAVEPEERLEHLLTKIGGDAGSAVEHMDLSPRARCVDLDRRYAGTMLVCVRDQILQHAPKRPDRDRGRLFLRSVPGEP